jgi:hypothetical protein
LSGCAILIGHHHTFECISKAWIIRSWWRLISW